MSRKNTKVTNTQKAKTEKRNLPPIESVRYDYQHNENRRELLDLIRNQQLIANNPHWVVNIAMELVPEILASDKYYLTLDNAEIIAKCLTLTMKNFKIAHDPEQDFKAFFKKWEKMPELVDGYEELVGELYKAINDDYNSDDILDSEYIGINKSDSMWLAMYITMSKGISLVLADTTLQFSASRSTKNIDDESEDGTEVETADTTSESESDTAVEDTVIEVVEGEVIDDSDKDSVDKTVEPDPIVIDAEVVSEEDLSEKPITKLGRLLCKELYNECLGYIKTLKLDISLNISDEDIMNAMHDIAETFLSSKFNDAQLETIEPSELVIQVKDKFIIRVGQELLERAYPDRDKEFQKKIDETVKQFPGIQDILTEEQLSKFVKICLELNGNMDAISQFVLCKDSRMVELFNNDLSKYLDMMSLFASFIITKTPKTTDLVVVNEPKNCNMHKDPDNNKAVKDNKDSKFVNIDDAIGKFEFTREKFRNSGPLFPFKKIAN